MRPIVVVTGGSRGIGAAVSRLAAARGYDVAINYARNEAAAASVAEDCQRAGARAEIIQGDMARGPDIERLFAEVDRRLGRLSHLVNNAGIVGPASRLDEAAFETIRACIDLNVTGAVLAAREAVRRLSPRHGGSGGSIVHISSMAARARQPQRLCLVRRLERRHRHADHGMSKELGGDRIRVNAVAPGMIDTDIHASTGQPDRLNRLAHTIPLGRAGTAEEVAEAVLFLMSDAAVLCQRHRPAGFRREVSGVGRMVRGEWRMGRYLAIRYSLLPHPMDLTANNRPEICQHA